MMRKIELFATMTTIVLIIARLTIMVCFHSNVMNNILKIIFVTKRIFMTINMTKMAIITLILFFSIA